MNLTRMPVTVQEYDAAAAEYVDEDDYTIDCDRFDEADMVAAGRSLSRIDPD